MYLLDPVPTVPISTAPQPVPGPAKSTVTVDETVLTGILDRLSALEAQSSRYARFLSTRRV